MVLVDSSVWIDFLRDIKSAQTDKLRELLHADRVLVGNLVMTEVLQGCTSDRAYDLTLHLLSIPPRVSIVNRTVPVQAARNYRDLRAKGITIRKTIDALIATWCIEANIPLLYSDRDFDPFVAHLGLISAMDPA